MTTQENNTSPSCTCKDFQPSILTNEYNICKNCGHNSEYHQSNTSPLLSCPICNMTGIVIHSGMSDIEALARHLEARHSNHHIANWMIAQNKQSLPSGIPEETIQDLEWCLNDLKEWGCNNIGDIKYKLEKVIEELKNPEENENIPISKIREFADEKINNIHDRWSKTFRDACDSEIVEILEDLKNLLPEGEKE